MNQTYTGTVSGILYENEDFRILRVILDEDKTRTPVSAKGNFPAQNLSVGSWVCFEAQWKEDPQYGRQLSVTRSPAPVETWTDERVLSALSANGVGPTVRMNLLAYCRNLNQTLQTLLDAGDLTKVPNLDEVTQLYVLGRWKSQRTYMDAAQFMAEVGLPTAVVSKVWSTFGTDIEEVITTDPWVLVRVAGITFKEADEIALRLGVPITNLGRMRGAVLSAVQETVTEGHVYCSTGQVVARVNSLIPTSGGAPPQEVAQAIGELASRRALIVEKSLVPGIVALYDAWHHSIEVQCAEWLQERALHPVDEDFLSLGYSQAGDLARDALEQGASLRELAGKSLEIWARGRKTSLTVDQTQAAVHALTAPVSLLTGLPGTGKTTTLNAVVSILRDSNIPFLLAAPTGIAAKRMSLVTGATASTVHRAFGAKGFMKDEEEREASYLGVTGSTKKKAGETNEGEDWDYGPGHPHPARVMVVDETSMLDLHMLYRLLAGTDKSCRILFVGDPFQLPSVGSGDVLRDLVESKVFQHSHLTQIFRQAETSGIVIAAHQVNAGKTPESDGKDFVLVPAQNEDEAASAITQIAQRLYEKRLNFQVLSPRHAGEAGVTSLNQRLRLALNPAGSGLSELKLAGSIVREGDRIMVVKNDYNLGVYNGDVGKVARIDKKAKEIELKIFEGPGVPPRMVSYPFKDASRSLRLAYCQTIHKSQGQEYDFIVIPILESFGRQLQRNLLYTGLTRGKKKVFLVGTQKALAMAVRNNQAEYRNTGLNARLRALLPPVGAVSEVEEGKTQLELPDV